MMPGYLGLLEYLFYQYVRRQIDNKSGLIGLSRIGQFWNGNSWKSVNYQGVMKEKGFYALGTFGLGIKEWKELFLFPEQAFVQSIAGEAQHGGSYSLVVSRYFQGFRYQKILNFL